MALRIVSFFNFHFKLMFYILDIEKTDYGKKYFHLKMSLMPLQMKKKLKIFEHHKF